MKLFIAAALAATALSAVSAPAMAQPYGPPPPPPSGDWHGQGPGYGPPPPQPQGDWHHPGGPGDWHNPGGPGGWDLDHRMDWMQDRINQGRQDGSLNGREASRVQRALNGIRAAERHDRWRNGGGLNDYDRQALQDRLDRLNDQIRWLRHNDVARPW